MSFEAKVYRILIASPSDVVEEREIVVKTIQEWNDINSYEKQIVLLPLRWETHTSPEYGKRPQEIINKQIVDHCDLLIGVFWTRIGTPTGVNLSGTLEEIERVASNGKPVMLYFSKVKQEPDEIDVEQLLKLRDFKKNTYQKALVENFNSQIEFRDKLTKHIELELRKLINDDSTINDSPFISDIVLEFFNLSKKINSGQEETVNIKYLELTNTELLPNYNEQKTTKDITKLWGDEINVNYYKEYANYYQKKISFFPFDFWLSNKGSLGAKDLYIDLTITSSSDKVFILTNQELDLYEPSKNSTLRYNNYFGLTNNNTINLTFNKKTNEWTAFFELKALQPKREISPKAILNITAKENAIVTINANIYADSLPQPIQQTLTLNLEVEYIKKEALTLLEELEILRKALN